MMKAVFASAIALAFAVPAFAQDEKKAEGSPAAAASPAAPVVGEALPKKENQTKYKACVKDAKDKDAKKACMATRKANRKARDAKVKAAWKAMGEQAKACKKGMRSCKKDKECKAKFMAHHKDLKAWKKGIQTWVKNGGDAKWDPPVAPEAAPAAAASPAAGSPAAASPAPEKKAE